MSIQSISLTSGMQGALFSLQGISRDIDRTQMRLSSGRKVNSALDNPTNFFAAQNHLNRASDLLDRKDAVNEALQAIKAANSGITAISSLLRSAKGIANTALGTSDQASRAATVLQFNEILTQIDTIKIDSNYRGINLLNNQSLTVNFSETAGRSALIITGVDVSSSGLGVNRAATSSSNASSISTSSTSTTIVSSNFALGGSDPVVVKSDGTITAITDYGGVPLPAGLSGVVSVTSGNGFSLALKDDGTVVGWGDDTYGQSSLASGLTGVTAVSAGADFGLALKSDGTVVAWGNNASGQTAVPAGLTGVVAVSAGADFGLALKGDGTVVAWGSDANSVVTDAALQSNITAISAGGAFALGLKADGTVAAWGDDSNNVVTDAALLANITSISAGLSFGLALKSDGTVAGWGDNSFTQTDIPLGLDHVVAVAAGTAGGLALKDDGTIVDWGAFSPYPPLSGVKLTGSTVTIETTTPGSSKSAWTTTEDIQASMDQLDGAIDKIRTTATTFSSNNSVITTRQSFIGEMVNILQTGSDNLTLADMNEEAAKMLMLQTRQSLAMTSLSIGSQAAQAVLKLF